MIRNELATREARERQERGIRVLDALFGYEPRKAPLNPQTGRAIEGRAARRLWREWRDSTFPARVRRRRRRKLARATTRRARRA